MKANKILTTILAGGIALSLVACGNQSTSTSGKHDEATSQVIHEAHHDKKTAKKAKQSSNSSQKSAAAANSRSNGNQASSSNSQQGSGSTVNNNQATMSESDARDLVKTHLGMQRDRAGQAGQAMPNQPTADAIDGFNATKNGNGWTVSGNYNGQSYTYHVSPNGVTSD